MSLMNSCTAVLALLVVVLPVYCEVISGTVVTQQPAFVYLGKFGYDAPKDPNSTSTLSYTITPTATGTPQYFLLYDDQKNSWPAAVNAISVNQSCQEAILYSKSLSGAFELPLTPGKANSNTIYVNEHLIPRYWYAVVANCYGPINITYEITFLQDTGSQFSEQFQGTLGLYIFFFLLFVAGTGWHYYYVVKFYFSHPAQSQKLCNLYTVALTCHFISLFMLVVDTSVYEGNGIGVTFFRGMASWLEEAAVIILTSVFLFTSCGYTPNLWNQRRVYVLLMTVYAIVNMIMLIWYYAVFSASWETNFVFDSVLGIILLVLRIIIGLFILVGLRARHTMESLPRKRQFFVRVGAISALWLILASILALSFNALPWYWQTRVQIGIIVFWNSIAFLAAGYLYRFSFMYDVYPDTGITLPTRSGDLHQGFLVGSGSEAGPLAPEGGGDDAKPDLAE